MPTEKRLAFICYRNADSGLIAHSLHGQLSKKLGSERLFLAPASIDGGEKWPSEIEDALVAAVVMVVLIGRDWIRVQNKYGQRLLDLPDDWVVREIHAALERQIPIIPVLLDGAACPTKEALPSDIKELMEHQTLHIRREASQELEPEDVRQLLRKLGKHLNPAIVGLRPYEAGDEDIFQHLQRKRELENCLKILTNPETRVVVLQGGPGCGKTSFLQAGVVPALGRPHANSYTGIYMQFTREDPFRTLWSALHAHLQLPANSLAGRDLRSWFNEVATQWHSPIVLLFDQFDEFFLHGQTDVHRQFVDGLRDWYEHQSNLRFKMLFCVNSTDQIMSLFDQIDCHNHPEFSLGHLSKDQAFAVLEALAKADGIPFEGSFVKETVLRELDSKPDGLLPLDLQMLAWEIRQISESNRGFTKASYKVIGGIKGSLGRLLDKELSREPDRKKVLMILGALIDQETDEPLSLASNQISPKLVMKLSEADIEKKLKKLAKASLVSSTDEDGVRSYRLKDKLVGQVLKHLKTEFIDVELANLFLDRYAQAYRLDKSVDRLKLKEYRLIERVWQQGKIRWGKEEALKKKIIERSRQLVNVVKVSCAGFILLIVGLGYSYMPGSGEKNVKEFLEKALNDKDKLFPKETLPKAIAALGEWDKWEEKANNFSKAIADRGRSELSLLAANQEEWNKAKGFATAIKNAELKALTFTDLAKKLAGSDDLKTRNGFVQSAMDAVHEMPEDERAERVHVLHYIQRRVAGPAWNANVTGDLAKEARSALTQIESLMAKLASSKGSSQEDVRLREQVRLLALAAVVESYAGEHTIMRKKLEDAKAILAKIKDGHDRSIAFHVLVQGMAECVATDQTGDGFYTTYLDTLVKLLPTSTSSREHILGLIEASGIILRATPPDVATALASEFLRQAEDLASNPRPDHEKQQPSAQKVPLPASFVLREVRTLQLAHAQFVSRYMGQYGEMQTESAIEMVRGIQTNIKNEMPKKESIGPERLDLLLTQLAVVRAFTKMGNPNDVREALIYARSEAKKLHNPHQKSAVLRAIVQIAADVDTAVPTDNTSAVSNNNFNWFAEEVLKDEILDPSDKGWASASYAISLVRQAANERRDGIGVIDRGMDSVVRMSSIFWEFLGKCTSPEKFSSSVMKAKQAGPAANFALYWVVREMANAQYWSCAHEELQKISDYTLQVSGYAAILLGDRADIPVFPKVGVLAESDHVRPQSQDLDQGGSMRLVPSGYFIMGTVDRDIDQSPPHHVYLDTFYIDEHEVTVDQYAQFLKLNPHDDRPQEWGEETVHNHGRKPVVGITYKNATRYCEWADKRLPTEAEWEKAARGTDGRIYPWGNDSPASLNANFRKLEWNDYEVLESVDSFEGGKSPYGVYHMAGNVWEWVEDWYSTSSYIHSSPDNPHGPQVGNWRVLRGGAWDNDEKRIEVTSRLYKDPPYHYPTIGFRCAR